MIYNWIETRPDGDNDRRWHCAASSSDGLVLLAGNGGPVTPSVFVSTDGGFTWSNKTPSGIVAGDWDWAKMSSGGQTMFISDYQKRMYKSTNYGDTWSEIQPEGDINRDWKFDCSANAKYILASNEEGLYLSSDYASSWTRVKPWTAPMYDTPFSNPAVSSDGSKMYVATTLNLPGYGVMYMSSDFGTSWTIPSGLSSYTYVPWHDVYCSGVGNVVSASEFNMLASINSFSSLIFPKINGNRFDTISSAMNYGGNIMIIGRRFAGDIYFSSNYGNTWHYTLDVVATGGCLACNSTGYKAIAGSSTKRLYIGTASQLLSSSQVVSWWN
jgi:hypothetical protein